MKFSMNGFRRQLSNDVAELRDLVRDCLNDNLLDPDELIDAMNQVIQHSNVVNCVYSNDDPDFSDISDIEIESLELDSDNNVIVGD